MTDEVEGQTDSNEETTRMRDRLGEINRILLTLEWDKQNNQFNPGMESKYTKLVTEREELTKKLGEI